MSELNQPLLDFLQRSPTPFHAVENLCAELSAAGFSELKEADSWQLSAGGRYFVTRNQSSVVAFVVGQADVAEAGIRMVGAHTDSPCLRVKPNPEINNKGYFQLGVEVYGGVLLHPWFDRDLSLAGRVSCLDANNQVVNKLVNFDKPVAVIPSLAIHLNREANEKSTVNRQKDLPPLLMCSDNKQDFRELLLAEVQKQDASISRVLDYELSFYDCQPPALIGFNDEFIASARLDNLLSCYIGLQALLQAAEQNNDQSLLLVCNDHEEVGSASAAGAQGPMLKTVLERWIDNTESRARAIDNSMMVSVDNAHGVHPNFSEKHDNNHGPKLNAGPVIKINANQRYASNSETQALFRHCCEQAKVPVQSFVVRSDMACGSTIGPITATELGVKTIDVGAPQFAMHSIRETCGAKDTGYLCQALEGFYLFGG